MIRPYHLKKGQHPYWIRTIRTRWHVCVSRDIDLAPMACSDRYSEQFVRDLRPGSRTIFRDNPARSHQQQAIAMKRSRAGGTASIRGWHVRCGSNDRKQSDGRSQDDNKLSHSLWWTSAVHPSTTWPYLS